jgi:hypothetical protein
MTDKLETKYHIYIYVGVLAIAGAMAAINRFIGEGLGFNALQVAAVAYFIGSVLWIVRSARKQRFEAPRKQGLRLPAPAPAVERRAEQDPEAGGDHGDADVSN